MSAELSANAVMKATNVDGVYTADPKRDAKATRYTDLTHVGPAVAGGVLFWAGLALTLGEADPLSRGPRRRWGLREGAA